MRGYFAQIRRAGFDIGLSAGQLTRAMVEGLSRLPRGAAPSKEVVVQHLGLLGQMTKTRDLDAAWNGAKRQIVREHPDRFRLDGRVLRWASETEDRPRAKLSTAGQRKLAALAAREGTTPDEQLWAFRQAFEDNVVLPADGFVIGEPVSVIAIEYDGNERRGLTVRCRREDGSEHVVAACDVALPAGSSGARHVAAYRRWLGLDPHPSGTPGTARHVCQHKATAGDLDLSGPVELIVLSVTERAARRRLPEANGGSPFGRGGSGTSCRARS